MSKRQNNTFYILRRGFISAFDIGFGKSPSRGGRVSGNFTDDARALARDWRCVGEDLVSTSVKLRKVTSGEKA